MRTFFNWKILSRIEQSPKEYVIQRNVDILSAFLFGYNGILLQLENIDELEQKYNDVQHKRIRAVAGAKCTNNEQKTNDK